MGEHACRDRAAGQTRAVPSVALGHVTVIAGQGLGDGRLSDAAATVGPVEQVAPVKLSEPRRHLAAGGARLPAREIVKPGKSLADVRVGGEPVFRGGVSLVVSRSFGFRGPACRKCRFPAEHGKAISDRSVGPGESRIEELLRLRPRSAAFWFLMPARDGARADLQVPRESLVAHPERGLKRARGLSGPAGRRFQLRKPPSIAKCIGHALVLHWSCITAALEAANGIAVELQAWKATGPQAESTPVYRSRTCAITVAISDLRPETSLTISSSRPSISSSRDHKAATSAVTWLPAPS